MNTADSEEAVLSALTRLTVLWNSPEIQTRVAREAGLALDSADIAPLYLLGMLGPSRPSEIAAELHLTRPTMSKQLGRLTAAGLVTRMTDPNDGRAAQVTLSPVGARAYRALVLRGIVMMREAFSSWTREDALSFATSLTRFVTQLGVGAPSALPLTHLVGATAPTPTDAPSSAGASDRRKS